VWLEAQECNGVDTLYRLVLIIAGEACGWGLRANLDSVSAATAVDAVVIRTERVRACSVRALVGIAVAAPIVTTRVTASSIRRLDKVDAIGEGQRAAFVRRLAVAAENASNLDVDVDPIHEVGCTLKRDRAVVVSEPTQPEFCALGQVSSNIVVPIEAQSALTIEPSAAGVLRRWTAVRC